MSKVFFDELEISEPEYNLEVGSASHGLQTGEMIKKIEEILLKEKYSCVVVYGDTNTTQNISVYELDSHLRTQ